MIYTTMGEVIGRIKKGEFTFDLSHYSNGIYFMRTEGLNQKIIKQ